MEPILFVNIPDVGLDVDLADDSWLPASFHGSEVASVSFFLQRQQGGVHLTGKMELVLGLQCDRCLDLYKKSISAEFSVDLVVGEPAPTSDDQVEYICSAADLDTMFVELPQVDLPEVARQQLYLQLPVKKICEADCPGLCQCGEKKGSTACTCKIIIDSPFAALAKLGVAGTD